jgi:hypothetical protein
MGFTHNFLLSEEGFDGFEFMVKDCSQYQLRLTKELGDFMFYQTRILLM